MVVRLYSYKQTSLGLTRRTRGAFRFMATLTSRHFASGAARNQARKQPGTRPPWNCAAGRETVGPEIRISGKLSLLADRFEAHDVNGDGCIDQQEFRTVMRSLGVGSDAADEMFDSYDIDRSGTISYAEYIRHTLRSLLAKSAKKRVVDIYRAWDCDDSKSITREEFYSALRKIGFRAPRTAMDALFDEMDTDGSGYDKPSACPWAEVSSALLTLHC